VDPFQQYLVFHDTILAQYPCPLERAPKLHMGTAEHFSRGFQIRAAFQIKTVI
jgi:hypothetical protein